MAERNLTLTKESTQNEIKSYFSAILELSKSDNEFPINLDEVWMLVYTRKSDAVEALQNSFIEGVDYQVLRKNPQNPNGGRPTTDYHLTVSCLEFFIARKVRPVFEVYRQVFHHAVKNPFSVPQTLSEALMLAAKQAEQLEVAQKQIEQKDRTIQANAPRVLFSQAVETSDRSILIGELAKILKQNGIEIGERRLFKWLREKGYLCSHGERYNQPTQRAMEMGLFELKKTTINKPDGAVLVTTTTKVTGKGQIYFVNKFLRQAA